MIPKLFKPLANIKKPPVSEMYEHCQIGHAKHKIIGIEVKLNGAHKGIKDVPKVPERLACEFTMCVYDWREYFKHEGNNITGNKFEEYCTGQDIISYSIDVQGVWEAYETLIALDILAERNKDAVVLDYGSHVGWYSILASMFEYRVASFDANIENIELLQMNAIKNMANVANIYAYNAWIDADAPMLDSNAEEVQFFKCDIEGAEKYAFYMCRDLFKNQRIKYAMIEISPTFNNSYADLVEAIANYGYGVYQIPGKGFAHSAEFSDQPLETIKKYCEVKAEGRREYVSSFNQENFLFIRQEKQS